MTTLEAQLQQSLDLVRGDPPLPLNIFQAVQQALRLRRDGLSYHAIGLVMGRYHGVHKTDDAWRAALRRCGAEPRHYSSGLSRIPPQMRGD